MRGEPVKTWDVDLKSVHVKPLDNGNMLSLGNISQPQVPLFKQTFVLRELSWDGDAVWEYGGLGLHHDFARLPGGNTLVPGRE